MKKLNIDETMRESVPYIDATFPVEICIDEYSQFANYTLDYHWHYDLEFGLVLDGTLEYLVGGTTFRLCEGDCYFINSNTLHMARQIQGNASVLVVTFSPLLLSGGVNSLLYQKYFRALLCSDIPGCIISRESAWGQSIADTLQEIHTLPNNIYEYELRCFGLICCIWEAAVLYFKESHQITFDQCPDRQNEERAKNIIRFIREHFAEPLTVQTIAERLHISRSECFRCLKRYTNLTPVELINDQRLTHAARLLLETPLSITEIGETCGFSSMSYFCRLFKAKFLLSPLQYRKQFR